MGQKKPAFIQVLQLSLLNFFKRQTTKHLKLLYPYFN